MTISEYLESNKNKGRGPRSVSELATSIGVSRQAVYNWMSGRCRPCFDNIVEIVRLSEGVVTHISPVTLVDSKTHSMFCRAWRTLVVAQPQEVPHV